MFPHGLLFHHFHNAAHPSGQGSITAETFVEILEYIGVGNLVSAENWMERALSGELSDSDICVTFDDNLRCQFDVALPVLRDLGINAFWFVYTSPLEGTIEKIELYRYFRSSQFDTTEAFYTAFYQVLDEMEMAERVAEKLSAISISGYLSDKPFYTLDDRKFRYIRTMILSSQEYDDIMERMIVASGLNLKSVASQLWMNKNNLQTLQAEGHIVGLHSHRHSLGIARADFNQQLKEYGDNYEALKSLLNTPPLSVSYPFGEFNEDTLSVMKSFGIKLGFRADMASPATSNLEFPRENHATTMMRMLS